MTPSHNNLPVAFDVQDLSRLDALLARPTSAPFASDTLDFLETFSRQLMTLPASREYPELVALGYWLRRANLSKMAKGVKDQAVEPNRRSMMKPLGTLVHFCPANVDTLFVYSWICSVLMGNNNIVRVSSRHSDLQQALMSILAGLFSQPEFSDIAQGNLIATWPHNDVLNAKVCQLVDGRVIWGGDQTINKIRAFPCQPRARDIAFADRFSVCVINNDAIHESEVKSLAELLWRDIRAYQQAACSSPRVLIWCGEVSPWQSGVVRELNQLALTEATSPSRVMNHLVTTQLLRVAHPDNKTQRCQGVTLQQIDKLSQQYLEWHPAEFFLYEYQANNLQQVLAEMPQSCQTLSYYGFDNTVLTDALEAHSGKGVDRVVPVGQALNFSEAWDGYHLLRQFSRELTLDLIT